MASNFSVMWFCILLLRIQTSNLKNYYTFYNVILIFYSFFTSWLPFFFYYHYFQTKAIFSGLIVQLSGSLNHLFTVINASISVVQLIENSCYFQLILLLKKVINFVNWITFSFTIIIFNNILFSYWLRL